MSVHGSHSKCMMQLVASIDGMTCSSCTTTVENALKSLSGVLADSVIVSLSTNTASVQYDSSIISPSTIIGSVEDIGFDAQIMSDSKVRSTSSKIKLVEVNPLKELLLSIDGMTCSSCSTTVENACRGLNGVTASSVVVSLTSNSATLLFDPSVISSSSIVEEIESVGFDVKILSESKPKGNSKADGQDGQQEFKLKTVLLSLKDSGHLSTADIRSSLETLRDALMNMNKYLPGRNLDIPSLDIENEGGTARDNGGVDSVDLLLSEAQVKVIFNDTLTGPRDFVAVAESLHLEVVVSSFGGFMMANRLLARQAQENREYLRSVLLAVGLTVPVVLVSMIFPMMGMFPMILDAEVKPGLTYSSIFLLVFTFPVQFIVGYRFHKKAYLSLKTRTLGMDFMISTGTLAAYFFSVIGMIRSALSGDSGAMMTSNYFDTSAVLITAVLLGKYLELYARGKTASAIHKLTGLKAKTARLVGSLPQDVYESQEESGGNNGGGFSPKGGRNALSTLSMGSAGSTSSTAALLSSYLPLRGHSSGESEPIIDASLLHKYDVIRLVTGESIPADGELLAGSQIGVDESMMTGESAMVTKKSKDFVYGGTTVVEGSALMRVTALGDDSTLGKILSTVQEAQTSKPPIQEFADRVARWFVPVVAGISGLTFVVWVVVSLAGLVPASWYEREGSPYLMSFFFALSVWVSACPCAFGLATPTAVLVATGIAAKYGVLVRRGASLQYAAEVNTVAFDKTGTLTRGCTEVSDFQFIDGEDGSVSRLPYYSTASSSSGEEGEAVQEEFSIAQVVPSAEKFEDLLYVLKLLLAAEVRSSHPLARGITTYCKQAIASLLESRDISDRSIKNHRVPVKSRYIPSENELVFDVVPGQGVHMHTDFPAGGGGGEGNVSVLVGSPKLLEAHQILVPGLASQIANGYRAGGKVALYLSINGVLRAVLGVSDAVRPEAVHVIAALKRRGIHCFMVTGDEPTTAKAIGATVGIPSSHILASAKPEDKEQFIAALQMRPKCRIAFVGDGTNDSPALARANVGFTMASGSDIAVEAGDMVLCKNDLTALLIALHLSRQTLSRIMMNYGWAFIYNLMLIPLASGVLYPALHFALSPMFAGAAMALSSVSIVVSSLMLLLFYRPPTVGSSTGSKSAASETRSRSESVAPLVKQSSGDSVYGLFSGLSPGGTHKYSSVRPDTGELELPVYVNAVEGDAAVAAASAADKLLQCSCPTSVAEVLEDPPSSSSFFNFSPVAKLTKRMLDGMGVKTSYEVMEDELNVVSAKEILASYKQEQEILQARLDQQRLAGIKADEAEARSVLHRTRSLRNRRADKEGAAGLNAIVGGKKGCGCGKGNCKCIEGCLCGDVSPKAGASASGASSGSSSSGVV